MAKLNLNYMTGQTYADSAGTMPQKSNLIRDDFKKIDIKGRAQQHYFSFRDSYLKIELCLEPCLNGFCVGMYNSEIELLQKKECTGLSKMIYKEETKASKENKWSEGFLEKLRMQDTMYGMKERNDVAWDKGVDIANRLYRQFRVEERLIRMRLMEEGCDKGYKYPQIKNPYYPLKMPSAPAPALPNIPDYLDPGNPVSHVLPSQL